MASEGDGGVDNSDNHYGSISEVLNSSDQSHETSHHHHDMLIHSSGADHSASTSHQVQMGPQIVQSINLHLSPHQHQHQQHHQQHQHHHMGGLKDHILPHEMVGMDHQVDGQQPPEKGDKRFGKRSDAAKKAVSEGMKKKASGRKEKRIVISLGDRLHVAQKLENKEITPKEAQEILQCCKSYVSQMMKPANLAKLRKKADLGLSHKLTKAHMPRFPHLEEELNRWAETCQRSNPTMQPPVSTTEMQAKALELAHSLGISDFKASNSWFSNFVKRYGLERMGFTGEDMRIHAPIAHYAVAAGGTTNQDDSADPLSQGVEGPMGSDCRFMLTPAG